jgi:hypothetical protein
MSISDTPKIWIDEDELDTYDNTSALMPVEETLPLPTDEERQDMLKASNVSKESKGILESVLELSRLGKLVQELRTQEDAEARRGVLDMFCENFVSSRMRNNIVAEKLKNGLLLKLLNNIENLDLELAGRLYVDLQETSTNDYVQAIGQINGTPTPMPGQPGINLTINNATSEGASITNQTLNTTGDDLQRLKETNQLNTMLHNTSKMQLPRQGQITVTQS